MKAVVFHEHGDVNVLQYEEVPKPKMGKDEALIRVKACALNYLDIWVRRGLSGLKLSMPHISGCDIAGVIEELGADVEGVNVGDRVVVNPGLSCGRCEYCRQGEDSLCVEYKIIGEHVDGGYAEFAKAPGRNLFLIPENISFEEAAAVPLVFLTAWRMLVTKAKVKPGEDVLVLGAGGGVASAAIQIAKLCGARVFVTASTDEKLQKAKELGADVLINYSRTEFDKEIWRLTNKRGVDVVLDHVGATTWAKSIKSLAKGGRLVTCGATTGPIGETDIRYVFWRQLQIFGSTMSNHKEFSEVLKLVWAGKLRPVIDRVLPLKDAAKAQQLMEQHVQFGKLILKP